MKKLRTVSLTLLLIVFGIASISVAQMEDLQKALNKMQGKTDDGEKPEIVDVINWKDLAPLLPASIDGYEAGDLDGGTMTMADPMGGGQFKYSSVSRIYKNGKKKITITIVDTGYKDILVAPYSYAIEYDSPDGSMKSIKINGFDTKEMIKLDNGEYKSSQLMTLVNKRVLVSFEADGGVQLAEINKQAEDFGFGKLEEMAKKTEKATEAE